MLKLNLAAGGRLEVPGYAIIGVMKPAGEGVNPSAIIYDLGEGATVNQLSDQYGFVKKLCIDNDALKNVVEVELVEKKLGDVDGTPTMTTARGKLTVSRDKIAARKDTPEDGDAKARIYVAAGNGVIPFNIGETLDEMDGIEPTVVKQKPAEDGPGEKPETAPAPAPTKPRRRGNTKDNTDGNV